MGGSAGAGFFDRILTMLTMKGTNLQRSPGTGTAGIASIPELPFRVLSNRLVIQAALDA